MKTVIDTSYHQFGLAPLDVAPVANIEPPDELMSFADDDTVAAVVVGVGVRDGRIEVSITTDPDEAWGPVEDEAEVMLDITEDLWLTSPTTENDLESVFSPSQPGLHYVRVRARGRRNNVDLSVDGQEPVEWYQIAIWPDDRASRLLQR